MVKTANLVAKEYKLRFNSGNKMVTKSFASFLNIYSIFKKSTKRKSKPKWA